MSLAKTRSGFAEGQSDRFVALGDAGGHVEIDFEPVERAYHYRVEISTGNPAEPVVAARLERDVTRVVLVGVPAGSYQVKLASFDDIGLESIPSPPRTIEVVEMGVRATSAPASPDADGGASEGDGEDDAAGPRAATDGDVPPVVVLPGSPASIPEGVHCEGLDDGRFPDEAGPVSLRCTADDKIVPLPPIEVAALRFDAPADGSELRAGEPVDMTIPIALPDGTEDEVAVALSGDIEGLEAERVDGGVRVHGTPTRAGSAVVALTLGEATVASMPLEVAEAESADEAEEAAPEPRDEDDATVAVRAIRLNEGWGALLGPDTFGLIDHRGATDGSGRLSGGIALDARGARDLDDGAFGLVASARAPLGDDWAATVAVPVELERSAGAPARDDEPLGEPTLRLAGTLPFAEAWSPSLGVALTFPTGFGPSRLSGPQFRLDGGIARRPMRDGHPHERMLWRAQAGALHSGGSGLQALGLATGIDWLIAGQFGFSVHGDAVLGRLQETSYFDVGAGPVLSWNHPAVRLTAALRAGLTDDIDARAMAWRGVFALEVRSW